MIKIQHIYSIEILDSRGNPTLKTYVQLENGIVTSASVPSGASTGTHEAVELRDDDVNRYGGKGVMKAVHNVNSVIAPHLEKMKIDDLRQIDMAMIQLDGTQNKSKLGANAILSVSLALTKAFAVSYHAPLWKTLHDYFFLKQTPAFPQLMVNIINGGRHATWNFDFQEFMITPKTNIPSQSIETASEIFHHLGDYLHHMKFSTLVGDEGGYSPLFETNEKALDILTQFGEGKVDIAIDAAASEFFDGTYYVFKKNHIKMTKDELREYYLHLQKKYQLFSVEDPFQQEDFESFQKLTAEGNELMVVGDDLYTTNPLRIKQGTEMNATNAVLIKPNQIGTVSETVDAITLAQKAGWKVIISHRSGETDETFIADLAVACGANFIKTGSMSRYERLAKYNRLLEIEKLEF